MNLLLRVKGFREKQYQLAAQKRNEAHLRFNYYSQIAGYFERECAITKQYNSWVAKDSETSSSYLQKKVKEKKLLARQEKLKILLEREEREYREECEQFGRNRKYLQRNDTPSLETLKQRLLEKKAHQNLPIPPARKRYQSYFYNSDSLISPFVSEQNSSKVSSASKISSNRMSLQGKVFFENDAMKYSQSRDRSPTSLNSSPQNNRSKSPPAAGYTRNYYRRTLEETNLRDESTETENATVVDFANNISNNEEQETEVLKAIDFPENKNPELEVIQENCFVQKDEETNVDEQVLNAESNDFVDENVYDSALHSHRSHDVHHPENQKDCKSYRYFSKVNDKGTKDDIERWQSEKSLPWSRMGNHREQNLSIPMFLYLTHNDMKAKILDLDKRELQACRAYRWEEALRFRDMRNRLSLNRENHLLNAVGLELDEDTRNSGLKSIRERERIISEREKVCVNESFYSEEAKCLWQKWMKEDTELEKDQANVARERLMSELENDWKALAIEDKDRISHLYEKTKLES